MQRKLFMVLIGATPEERYTEQHDIFFGIGNSLVDLVPQMLAFWPNAKLHIDAWREVTKADGHSIEVVDKSLASVSEKLFFINLGGYKIGEFEEYHYKVLAVGETMAIASKKSRQTAFYRHYGFKSAGSHIDDKYGIDVDNIYDVHDILNETSKIQYGLRITAHENAHEDEFHLGYVRLEKLLKSNVNSQINTI